jgi:hypothetical protein
VIGVLVMPAWAQRRERKSPKVRRPTKAARGKLTMEGLRDELNLTSRQEPQVEQLYRTLRQAQANWMSENGTEYRALVTKIRDARKSGDREASLDAQKKLRDLMASRSQLEDNFFNQLGDVLDEQQTAKARTVFGRRGSSRRADRAGGPPADPMRVLMAMRGLDLSPQQRTRVSAILAKAVAAIEQQVLTALQRQQLDRKVGGRASSRAPGGRPSRLVSEFRRLGLSREQQARIEAMERDAAAQAAKMDSAELKRQILDDLHRRVYEEVLTDEQRRRLDQTQSRRRKIDR